MNYFWSSCILCLPPLQACGVPWVKDEMPRAVLSVECMLKTQGGGEPSS